MQNKEPKNDKRQRHGLWEKYYPNNKLCYTGNYINGNPRGFFVGYLSSSQLYMKNYYAR